MTPRRIQSRKGETDMTKITFENATDKNTSFAVWFVLTNAVLVDSGVGRLINADATGFYRHGWSPNKVREFLIVETARSGSAWFKPSVEQTA